MATKAWQRTWYAGSGSHHPEHGPSVQQYGVGSGKLAVQGESVDRQLCLSLPSARSLTSVRIRLGDRIGVASHEPPRISERGKPRHPQAIEFFLNTRVGRSAYQPSLTDEGSSEQIGKSLDSALPLRQRECILQLINQDLEERFGEMPALAIDVRENHVPKITAKMFRGMTRPSATIFHNAAVVTALTESLCA